MKGWLIRLNSVKEIKIIKSNYSEIFDIIMSNCMFLVLNCVSPFFKSVFRYSLLSKGNFSFIIFFITVNQNYFSPQYFLIWHKVIYVSFYLIWFVLPNGYIIRFHSGIWNRLSVVFAQGCQTEHYRTLVLAVASDKNTMAASTANSKGAELSKAEYLKRYLSADDGGKKSKGKIKKKRRKVPGKGWVYRNVLMGFRHGGSGC